MDERIIKLIGEDNLNEIKKKTVCIIGLGGVGGYALESLIRSGINNLIIVDYDTVDISNLNRQIITNISNIGLKKTDVAFDRIKSINPDCHVILIDDFITKDNINKLFEYKFDYLIDACDTISTKQLLIEYCLVHKIKFISCMGTGNKIDPSKLEICDIRKTSYDPIAKKIRKYVSDNKISGKIPVVYSKEIGKKFDGDIPSMIFVPATAGLLLANYVIKDIISS